MTLTSEQINSITNVVLERIAESDLKYRESVKEQLELSSEVAEMRADFEKMKNAHKSYLILLKQFTEKYNVNESSTCNWKHYLSDYTGRRLPNMQIISRNVIRDEVVARTIDCCTIASVIREIVKKYSKC